MESTHCCYFAGNCFARNICIAKVIEVHAIIRDNIRVVPWWKIFVCLIMQYDEAAVATAHWLISNHAVHTRSILKAKNLHRVLRKSTICRTPPNQHSTFKAFQLDAFVCCKWALYRLVCFVGFNMKSSRVLVRISLSLGEICPDIRWFAMWYDDNSKWCMILGIHLYQFCGGDWCRDLVFLCRIVLHINGYCMDCLWPFQNWILGPWMISWETIHDWNFVHCLWIYDRGSHKIQYNKYSLPPCRCGESPPMWCKQMMEHMNCLLQNTMSNYMLDRAITI